MPCNAKYWYWQGRSLWNLKKYEEAIIYYKKATELNPEYTDCWYWQGQTLGILKKYEEAIVCYQKATELNPDNASHWYGQGLALGILKKRLSENSQGKRILILSQWQNRDLSDLQAANFPNNS